MTSWSADPPGRGRVVLEPVALARAPWADSAIHEGDGMRRLGWAKVIAVALGAAACSGGPSSAGEVVADLVTPPTTADGMPASFGVPECDHYATAACSCANASYRATACSSVNQAFTGWRIALLADSSQRTTIAQGCAAAEAALAAGCTGSVEGAAAAAAAAAAGHPSTTWDGHSQYSCATGEVTLTGITGAVPGESAIYAAGDCHLTLTNMTVSGQTAVEAAGAAVVTIVGGSYTGTENAIEASGGAHVTVSGSPTVSGHVLHMGDGVIEGIASTGLQPPPRAD